MDCPKTTMVLSVGCVAVWPFSGAACTAVTPAPKTNTASSSTNRDTAYPYFCSLRMFPPATSAPSLTHTSPEKPLPHCSEKISRPSSPEQAPSAGRFGALIPSLYPLTPASQFVLHSAYARANRLLPRRTVCRPARQRPRFRLRLQRKGTRPALFRHHDDRRKVHESDHQGQGSSV